MKKTMVMLVGCAAVLAVAAPLYGQNGCTDSPENPTSVLALVGGAGALLSSVWAKMRAQRKK